jgi:hypothetical protein
MKWFSQRKEFKKVSDVIQTETMSEELRNSLWNALDIILWSRRGYTWREHGQADIKPFSKVLWFDFFKKPIDTIPNNGHEILKTIRKYFFGCKWFESYDLLEFIVSFYENDTKLVNILNVILEQGLAGYRLIGGHVVDITDKQEVEMLESALEDTKYEGVNAHLKRALELLSNREKPDYRNSIKESISAVESIAKIITNNPSATLGQALKVLESNSKIHPALKNGFSSLYGYTSDKEGIRHAMLEEPSITAADAKYFLLSCTSFVNYLKSQI